MLKCKNLNEALIISFVDRRGIHLASRRASHLFDGRVLFVDCPRPRPDFPNVSSPSIRGVVVAKKKITWCSTNGECAVGSAMSMFLARAHVVFRVWDVFLKALDALCEYCRVCSVILVCPERLKLCWSKKHFFIDFHKCSVITISGTFFATKWKCTRRRSSIRTVICFRSWNDDCYLNELVLIRMFYVP